MMTTTNNYIDWIFQTNAGRNIMSHYVALVADATGRYAHVYVPGRNWSNVVDQLEDIGCEVVENQTDDYELEDFASPENLEECGLVTIAQLTGANSSFISC
jgi:hypothetical protein